MGCGELHKDLNEISCRVYSGQSAGKRFTSAAYRWNWTVFGQIPIP